MFGSQAEVRFMQYLIRKEMKTKHQLQILKWLEIKDVLIEHRSNGKYYLTKFGLTVKKISESTFEAVKDELQLHNFNGRTIYSLKS